jgi:hypothetical protein
MSLNDKKTNAKNERQNTFAAHFLFAVERKFLSGLKENDKC